MASMPARKFSAWYAEYAIPSPMKPAWKAVRPQIDPLNYVAAFRSDRPNSMVGPLSDLAVSLSNFERKRVAPKRHRKSVAPVGRA